MFSKIIGNTVVKRAMDITTTAIAVVVVDKVLTTGYHKVTGFCGGLLESRREKQQISAN